jgi:formate dehydrogenase (hydrogenase)
MCVRSDGLRLSRRGETVEQAPTGRLTTPLIRDKGKHRPATWEEVLDRVADGIRSEVARHGPRTFGMFSCSKTTNELNYIAQKFVRSVIGCNNIDSCNRT